MQEEVDYAEMLEIPVSTVNVVRKKNKRKGDIKEKVIERVNERMEEPAADFVGEEESRVAESVLVEGGVDREKERGRRIVVGEFIAACLLCVCIFLTNVFMSDSAINTFMNSLFSPAATAADKRTYTDFTLSGIVSERSALSVETSPTGVMSFTGETMVYPVCDGKVGSLSKGEEGYTLVISHSDSFQSIVTGLTNVYYAVGETVKGNLPVGYTDGGNTVQVMLYEKDSLLNCFAVDSKNCISWKE